MLSLTEKRHYTVQVGAFRNWENTRDFIGVLQKKGLEGDWVEINTVDGDTLYRVFSGDFIDSNEAVKFMKDSGIFTDYPGSFVREIPSREGKRHLPPGANWQG